MLARLLVSGSGLRLIETRTSESRIRFKLRVAPQAYFPRRQDDQQGYPKAHRQEAGRLKAAMSSRME